MFQIQHYPYLDSIALFSKVADKPWAILLDSGAGNKFSGNDAAVDESINEDARFDILACQPNCTLVTKAKQTTIRRYVSNTDYVEELSDQDPIELLKNQLPKLSDQSQLELENQLAKHDLVNGYVCGALGYFSYDLARRYETLPSLSSDLQGLPEMAMGIYNSLVVVDHKLRRTLLISYGKRNSTARLWPKLIEDSLSDAQESHDTSSDLCVYENKILCTELSEDMDQALYEKKFNKVKKYIQEGDCYQVNLAKYFAAPVSGDAWQTYCYLRGLSPAPYASYMNFPFAQILSNSPESFIKSYSRQVTTSPIKGTRARDHLDTENDKLISQELYNSSKDRAENLMIVDLMRNDLSRCCELNSIKVPELFKVHKFANVHHLISTVTGRLEKKYHALDLFRSCFPGGSITGAPKIRAMQIIEELETQRRGLYCGSIGYIGFDGSLQSNIAIRTIVVKDHVARFSAGGGLVVDSDMREEYQEIIDKASMMSRAMLDDI